MFMQGDTITVNAFRPKLTKGALLFDIEMINKYKEQGRKDFVDILGMTKEFLELLENYDITESDIRKAVSNGKNYYRTSGGYRKSEQGNYYISERYIVGR